MQSGIILFVLKYVKETVIAVMGTGVAVTNNVIFSNLRPVVAVQKNTRQHIGMFKRFCISFIIYLHLHSLHKGFLSRNNTSLDL